MNTAKLIPGATNKMTILWQNLEHSAIAILISSAFVGLIAQFNESAILGKIAESGLMASLVVFFIWISYKREVRLVERVNQLEDFIRTRLVDMVSENNTTIHRLCEELGYDQHGTRKDIK